MSPTLEKIARASAHAAHVFYNGSASEGLVWASLDREAREVRLVEARAALLAMREPTVGMHNAGVASEGQAKAPVVKIGENGVLMIDWRGANPSQMFTAMIDAILAGETET